MRRSGVLLPVFSIPSPEPVGTIGGIGVKNLLKFLVDGGFKLWQILPVPPEGRDNCPYAGVSAFAVDPLFISVEELFKDGYLKEDIYIEAMKRVPKEENRVLWDFVKSWKLPLLVEAVGNIPTDELKTFLEEAKWWLDDWALWWAFSRPNNKPSFDSVSWRSWPEYAKKRSDLGRMREERSELYNLAVGMQFLVDKQWKRTKAMFNAAGVSIMGDLPIYVDGNGADAWSYRKLFQVSDDESQDLVAGVPPDAFCADGQRWDNPVYDWVYSETTGHAWWRDRFRRLLELTDEIRVDHFRGFFSYFAFPFDKSPKDGQWYEGPKASLFHALEEELREIRGLEPNAQVELPVVVEDLGYIEPEVEALRDDLKLPGTKVIQFGFDGDPTNVHFPPNFKGTRWAACTGTHDLQPIKAWFETTPDWVKDNFFRFAQLRPGEFPAGAMVRVALESSADHVILPLQDIMGTGEESRVNVPGTREGNWEWRAKLPDEGTLVWIRSLNIETNR